MSKSMKNLSTVSVLLYYFALKPLYLSGGGALQIADLLLVLTIGMYIIKKKGVFSEVPENGRIIYLFFAVIMYQIMVNIIWSGITGDMSMNFKSLYYVFNFMAFSFCISLSEKCELNYIKKKIAIGCFFSVFVVTIGILFFDKGEQRATGFFDNPNQLGYFAVITITVCTLCKEQLKKYQKILIVAFSVWATIISLSKAAIISLFGFAIINILFSTDNSKNKVPLFRIGLIIALAFFIYLLFFANYNFLGSISIIQTMRHRIFNMMNESDSNLGNGRGYARIFEIGINIFWGAGEGAYDRFVAKHGGEVHSTFVSLLTCYGVIGFIGYINIFFRCLCNRVNFKRNIVLMSGLFLYAITHNGIRNTLLWIILAILYLENKLAITCDKEDNEVACPPKALSVN